MEFKSMAVADILKIVQDKSHPASPGIAYDLSVAVEMVPEGLPDNPTIGDVYGELEEETIYYANLWWTEQTGQEVPVPGWAKVLDMDLAIIYFVNITHRQGAPEFLAVGSGFLFTGRQHAIIEGMIAPDDDDPGRLASALVEITVADCWDAIARHKLGRLSLDALACAMGDCDPDCRATRFCDHRFTRGNRFCAYPVTANMRDTVAIRAEGATKTRLYSKRAQELITATRIVHMDDEPETDGAIEWIERTDEDKGCS